MHPQESPESSDQKRLRMVHDLLAAAIGAKGVQSNTSAAVTQPFNRSKIMFVGRGRAGKTSTVGALLGRPLSAVQPSTIGCASMGTRATLDSVDAAAWKEVEPGRELQRVVVAQMPLRA